MLQISVCMATYNGELYISDQISSILNQLSLHDELIISDDFSTDQTLNIIKSFNDQRIKIVFNKMDVGYAGNFENAINNASGDLIFLSDQDDVWVEDRVKKMTHLLISSNLVVCNADYVDKNLQSLNQTLFSLRGGKKGFGNNLYKLRYLGACMAFRRDIFPKLLPFPKNKVLCPHDMWIALICEFYYKVEITSESLILYRRHGSTTSNGGQKSPHSIARMILFRVYSFAYVLSRFIR